MAALPLFLAMLLGMSAVHKAVDRERLALAAARLAGARQQAGPLLLIAAGAAEMTAALCWLVPALRLVGAVIAIALWAGYALALLRRRGQSLDCGCDLVARERPVGLAQILRPVALALLAAGAVLVPQAPFTLDAPFAAAAFLALFLGASEILAIPQPSWRKN
ncbi:MauE/DoxX family redox-associated membrane protein [Sphingobium sp. EM0848]|uniref:MauE/DoxX family redox-associated membrane protein n=1 Tax=Sphingobium sp. EM0848 TaxID=2743473 RepID=UPI00159C6AAE|nr:MauE/DoxX family redox-associated membrane protein [Sphingobium sp. EM0848]